MPVRENKLMRAALGNTINLNQEPATFKQENILLNTLIRSFESPSYIVAIIGTKYYLNYNYRVWNITAR